MDISQELELIQNVGIGGTAFILVYILLKHMISRNFQQADTIIELARTTILDNTKALENLHQALMEHIRQKEVIVDKMKECRKDRDTKFTELLKKKKYD